MKEKVQIVLFNGDIEERELERVSAYCPNCKKKWFTHSTNTNAIIKKCINCFLKEINKAFDSLLEDLGV